MVAAEQAAQANEAFAEAAKEEAEATEAAAETQKAEAEADAADKEQAEVDAGAAAEAKAAAKQRQQQLPRSKKPLSHSRRRREPPRGNGRLKRSTALHWLQWRLS